MNDLFDVCFTLGVIFGFLVLIVALVAGGVALVDYASCRGFARGTGIETRWTWGCYAHVDGQWIPKDYVFGKAHELRMKDKR